LDTFEIDVERAVYLDVSALREGGQRYGKDGGHG
jgi:hypothetical protein